MSKTARKAEVCFKTADDVLNALRAQGTAEFKAKMAYFALPVENALGVSTDKIRAIARQTSKSDEIAQGLWATGISEARTVAVLLMNPKNLTSERMDTLAADFDSWGIVDQCCYCLFIHTPFIRAKIDEWATREEEFVRRSAFASIAALAVHDKKMKDDEFEHFFDLIVSYSHDGRNFVKKAVNWALRQIGKRNNFLNKRACEVARSLLTLENRSATWIAKNALRELESEAVTARLARKSAQ